MPRTAEQQRAYRELQKAQLGEEAYKKIQALKKRELRARNKAKQAKAQPTEEQQTEAKQTKEQAEAQPAKAQPAKEQPAKTPPKIPKRNKITELTVLVLRLAKKYNTDDIKRVLIDNFPDVKDEKEGKEEKEQKDNCEGLKNAIKEQSPDLSDKTLKQYHDTIKRIYKRIFKDDWDCVNFQWLKKSDEILKWIDGNTKTKATRSAYINAITSILKRLPEYKELYKIYSNANTEQIKAVQNERDESKLTERELKNYLPWEEILKIRNSINNPRDLLLYSLYTDIPPRRVDDYRLMKFTENKADTNDKNFNWLYFQRGEPVAFIYNIYKTSKNYGTFINDEIPDDMAEILENYAEEMKLKNGEFLFKNAKGLVYPQSNFTDMVKRTFKKYTGKGLSVNLLRHSFITFTRKEKLSMAQKKEIASKMGHRITTAEEYEKLDG